MAGKLSFEEGAAINKPPLFYGLNYKNWEARMKIFVLSKQPLVTCFYGMKKGHSVRFCKIRKYAVPRGFMKWIPKCCKGSNDECKPNGPTFIRGPNLCT